MDKLFIDTNILVDVLLARDPFLGDSQRVLSLGVEKKAALFCSEIALPVVYYLGRKGGMTHAGLVDWMRKLSTFVTVANTGHPDVLSALTLASGRFPDFEDALQYVAAKAADVDFLITRNARDFRAAEIPVISPGEYLRS